MNDKSKITLFVGPHMISYHTRAALSCDMRPHKLNLIQLAVPNTHVVFLLSQLDSYATPGCLVDTELGHMYCFQ